MGLPQSWPLHPWGIPLEPIGIVDQSSTTTTSAAQARAAINNANSESEGREAVRADKWLWAARFFKTRGLAAAACTGGKVEVNDQPAKPARPLRPGDLLRVTLPAGKRVVKIVALAERRGPAPSARALY